MQEVVPRLSKRPMAGERPLDRGAESGDVERLSRFVHSIDKRGRAILC